MELIQALADGADVHDTLRRLEATAPPGAQFLTVTMPPFRTQRDQDVITGLADIGWRVLGNAGRTVFLTRTQADLPARFTGLAGGFTGR